ncbi:ORF2b [Hana virus]|uniref:ORF2b n=1 Tax=Hana virus TaxID=1286140 RepID=M4JYQ5_9NIDO|nr:ORF2b [Alphamesonivirus 2]AGE00051.1 ORF2b [Hana virus]
MPAASNNANNNQAKPGPSRQNQQPKTTNGNAMAPKPQRQRKQNNSTAPPKQAPASQPKQNRNPPKAAQQPKVKKAIATGPNYTETNGKLYKIGKEFDARNHMGWRRNEKTGSTVQFLFKPKMASRIDQVYYRNQFEDADHYIHTFGVGVFVQDSTLERNAIYNHAKLTPEEKDEYVRKLSDAFNAILLRTRKAFDTNALPNLTVDAA